MALAVGGHDYDGRHPIQMVLRTVGAPLRLSLEQTLKDDLVLPDHQFALKAAHYADAATDQPMGDGQRRIELTIPGADTSLALFTPPGHESRIGGFQPMTFWCDDVFATAAAMKAKGVELAAEPRKEIWGTMAIFKFKDPDGNRFMVSSR